MPTAYSDLTVTQQARHDGFKEQLRFRGVTLTVQGSNPAQTFDALIEDMGNNSETFAIDKDARMLARVTMLYDAPGVDALPYATVFLDPKSGKTYTLIGREIHDIKFAFRCTVITPTTADPATDSQE